MMVHFMDWLNRSNLFNFKNRVGSGKGCPELKLKFDQQ